MVCSDCAIRQRTQKRIFVSLAFELAHISGGYVRPERLFPKLTVKEAIKVERIVRFAPQGKIGGIFENSLRFGVHKGRIALSQTS